MYITIWFVSKIYMRFHKVLDSILLTISVLSS